MGAWPSPVGAPLTAAASAVRAEGALAGFESDPGLHDRRMQPKVASNGLPVNAQLAGDVPVGPAASRKCQNCLYFRHLELIGHRTIGFRQTAESQR